MTIDNVDFDGIGLLIVLEAYRFVVLSSGLELRDLNCGEELCIQLALMLIAMKHQFNTICHIECSEISV